MPIPTDLEHRQYPHSRHNLTSEMIAKLRKDGVALSAEQIQAIITQHTVGEKLSSTSSEDDSSHDESLYSGIPTGQHSCDTEFIDGEVLEVSSHEE